MSTQIPDGAFWAKLERADDGQIERWHPLLNHSADVAAMTYALLEHTILNQRLANISGLSFLTEVQIQQLSFFAAIHDAGKVNHGFQNLANGDKRLYQGHVAPIVESINGNKEQQEKILIPLGIEGILPWFETEEKLIDFLLATWGHHGHPVIPEYNFDDRLWVTNIDRDPQQGLEQLGRAAKAWFPRAFEEHDSQIPSTSEFTHAFNGVLTLADWLGSDTRFFPFTESTDQYFEKAQRQALEAISTLSIAPKKYRGALGAEKVTFALISDFEPYEIQQACLDLPLHEKGSVTILESDTGSGKTEAALIRFLKLYQAGLVDGIYFAVPTRSAATQLYQRVVKATQRAFPQEATRPPVVQAVSGYIKVDDVEGFPLPRFNVKWPDDASQLLKERSWAAEHPKRYLAGTIVVGTIDQVLLSVLQTNHAHMRFTSLLRHLLVIDEVHASDTYMTRLLETVLDNHLKAGGHALLMSATLGTSARLRLATKGSMALTNVKDAAEIAYPLITHVDAERKTPSFIEAASSGKQKTILPSISSIAEHPDQIAKHAIEAAKNGAKVLIIRNLVKDCIATQKAVEAQAGNNAEYLFSIDRIPAPHHSRFAPDDRKKLDRQIEQAFGKQAGSKPVIAVATQTVEQSLDIDADYLITDLCPVDVLLQRLGRLHRHSKTRPKGFEVAQCMVLTPEQRDLSHYITPKGEGRKGKHGLGTVYQDLRIIEATWRLLEEEHRDTWDIPFDNRALVENAMHPELLNDIVNELGDRWEKHQEYIYGSKYADGQLSALVGIDFSRPFSENGFPKDTKKIRTRLGREDYQLFLSEAAKGPFGNEISEITLTEWQLDEIPTDNTIKEITEDPDSGSFSFTFQNQSFTYSRMGLAPNQ